jgi:hypothetical protein
MALGKCFSSLIMMRGVYKGTVRYTSGLEVFAQGDTPESWVFQVPS